MLKAGSQWVCRSHSTSLDVIDRFLVGRNYQRSDRIDMVSIRDISDPFNLKDIDKAVDRLYFAIKKKQPVFVHGDYDTDGATASAVIKHFLTSFGVHVIPWIPDRFEDGYGLSKESVRVIANSKTPLVITVDCGISDNGIARQIESLTGSDVIVTDHHDQVNGYVPECHAVINPKRSDCQSHLHQLAGVGVAWKLVHATMKKLYPKGIPDDKVEFLESLLGLVAIGTVADMVPIVGENRFFVYKGIQTLREYRLPFIDGVMKFLQKIGRGNTVIDESFIGFKLAPSINAVSREKCNAKKNVDLFCSTSVDEAYQIYETNNALNENRKERQTELTEVILKNKEHINVYDKSIVINGGDFKGHDIEEGIMGILASQILDVYQVPVTIFSGNEKDGIIKGSIRTNNIISASSFINFIKEKKIISHGGGHSAAGGLGLPVKNIQDFRKYFNDYSTKNGKNHHHKIINYDTDITVDKINEDFINHYGLYGPYANAEKPSFLTCGRITNVVHLSRKNPNDQHRILNIKDGMNIFQVKTFNFKKIECEINSSKDYEMIITPSINIFNGRKNVEFLLVDLREKMDLVDF